jgi:hypothetical protein
LTCEKPLAIDLFCGLGGWTEGLLAEDYDVIGFDIERHDYGDQRYPAQLVLQDVLTLHGSQFRDAALIVASPPCQEYSYMAMPWSRAKQIAAEYRSGARDVRKLTALFDACFRIQREASEAAGHHIPLVVENVRGAIPWVGRSRWNFGSFHLWGDVPALMPMAKAIKMGRAPVSANGTTRRLTNPAEWRDDDTREFGTKNNGGSWFAISHNKVPHSRGDVIPDDNGRKVSGDWFGSYADMKASGTISPGRLHGKNSPKRKAASAMIAKIPLPLSRYIAAVYRPQDAQAA